MRQSSIPTTQRPEIGQQSAPTLHYGGPWLRGAGGRHADSVFNGCSQCQCHGHSEHVDDPHLGLFWLQFTAGGSGSGWNLIGNPYTCGLDWSTVSLTNVNSAFYIWDPATTTYKYYSGAGLLLPSR